MFVHVDCNIYNCTSTNTLCHLIISSSNCLSFRLHPYLFFNRDLASLTYIGFNINDNGDLINPTNHEVVEKSVISKQLVQDLKVNYCDFQESFISLQKYVLYFKFNMIVQLNISTGMNYWKKLELLWDCNGYMIRMNHMY